MGIFSVFGFLKKKAKSDDKAESSYSSLGLPEPTFGPPPASAAENPFPSARPPLNLPNVSSTGSSESASQENLKAKIDLMMTQIDSMKIQSQSMNERILQIENMVKQLLDMARR